MTFYVLLCRTNLLPEYEPKPRIFIAVTAGTLGQSYYWLTNVVKSIISQFNHVSNFESKHLEKANAYYTDQCTDCICLFLYSV